MLASRNTSQQNHTIKTFCICSHGYNYDIVPSNSSRSCEMLGTVLKSLYPETNGESWVAVLITGAALMAQFMVALLLGARKQ